MFLQKEIDFLRRELASTQLENKLCQEQVKKCLEPVADSRNAFHLAMSAQAMASEALIKASTGRTLDEMTGLEEGSSQNGKIVPFDNDKKSARSTYFENLGDDPIRG